MRILINGMGFGLRLNSNDEHIGLVVDKTAYQRLVLICLRTLDRHTLSLTCHIV
jgi:hypothetical protein